MLLDSLDDLKTERDLAVVINVGTELVTTLAIASALRHCPMPLLLINCEPTAQSDSYFKRLMAEWKFDILNAPRSTHGSTLDVLFREVKSERVLLLDSDAEIRDGAFVEKMRLYLENPLAFGAGFTQGPGWMDELDGFVPGLTIYHERPWMPCVYFRTSDVVRALDAGKSFNSRIIYNEFAPNERISRFLGKRLREGSASGSTPFRRLPGAVRSHLTRTTFRWLRWARRDFYGLRPNSVYCDTGADVFTWCKYQDMKLFGGLPVQLLNGEVAHYVGVTRQRLDPAQRRGGRLDPFTAVWEGVEVETDVLSRLSQLYDVDFDSLYAEHASSS
jgi:hypothetical protein